MAKSPRLGAAGVVWRDGKILLGRRAKDPLRGIWVLPGGGVRFGETLAEAFRREIREEANVEIFMIQFLRFKELIRLGDHHEEHRVVAFHKAVYRSGTPISGGDCDLVEFCDEGRIFELYSHGLLAPSAVEILAPEFRCLQ